MIQGEYYLKCFPELPFKIHFSVGSPFFFTPRRAQEIISNLHFVHKEKRPREVSASCPGPLAGWLQRLGSYDAAFGKGTNDPLTHTIKASSLDLSTLSQHTQPSESQFFGIHVGNLLKCTFAGPFLEILIQRARIGPLSLQSSRTPPQMILVLLRVTWQLWAPLVSPAQACRQCGCVSTLKPAPH